MSKEKIDILCEGLRRSQVKEFNLTNLAMPFDMEGERDNFLMNVSVLKELPINVRTGWGIMII
jgi:hypothetical protein